MRKTEISKKTSKFQLKQAQEQATAILKKIQQLHKKQAQILKKNARLATLTLLSVGQTAVFPLENIWYCDETTMTLIGFLKFGQVSEFGECKAKPRRTC